MTTQKRSKTAPPVFLDDGRIKLKDVQAKETFDAEIKKLLDTEVSDLPDISIKESDFHSVEDLPTPSDMLILENIITFED